MTDLASIAALLWRDREPRANTPRTRLGVDMIVAAGIAAADADGLGAVSMQRVAADLGYTTMALYRHVPGKTHLLAAMADDAAGTPPTPAGDWRADVEAWAKAAWDSRRRHPWTLSIPTFAAPLGPGELAWSEALLACLDGTGLPDTELVPMATFLSAAVRDLARTAIAIESSEYDRILADHVDPARFPRLHRTAPAPHDPLTPGLRRLLDGVAALLPTTKDTP